MPIPHFPQNMSSSTRMGGRAGPQLAMGLAWISTRGLWLQTPSSDLLPFGTQLGLGAHSPVTQGRSYTTQGCAGVGHSAGANVPSAGSSLASLIVRMCPTGDGGSQFNGQVLGSPCSCSPAHRVPVKRIMGGSWT